MQFTPAQLLHLLAANWPRAARLVAWAVSVLKTGEDGCTERWRLYEAARILRPAESMARRLLLIMACRQLPNLPPRPAVPSSAPIPFVCEAQQAASDPSSPPCFSPIEPTSSARPAFHRPRPAAWPSIWSPGQVRAESLEIVRPDPMARVDAGPLLRRAASLGAIIADPEPAARRLARWLQRAMARPRHLPGRSVPVRPPGLIPGRGSSALDRLTRSALDYSAAGAEAALTGAWNSS